MRALIVAVPVRGLLDEQFARLIGQAGGDGTCLIRAAGGDGGRRGSANQDAAHAAAVRGPVDVEGAAIGDIERRGRSSPDSGC